MAQKSEARKKSPFLQKRIGAGMLVSVVGLLWLTVELGIIRTSIPVGPISVVIIGIALIAREVGN
jgi:hypothetical protein